MTCVITFNHTLCWRKVWLHDRFRGCRLPQSYCLEIQGCLECSIFSFLKYNDLCKIMQLETKILGQVLLYFCITWKKKTAFTWKRGHFHNILENCILRNLSSFSWGNIVEYYRIMLDTKYDGRISVLTQIFLPNLLITTMLCLSKQGNSSKPLCKPVLIETSVVRSSHM